MLKCNNTLNFDLAFALQPSTQEVFLTLELAIRYGSLSCPAKPIILSQCLIMNVIHKFTRLRKNAIFDFRKKNARLKEDHSKATVLWGLVYVAFFSKYDG